MTQTTITETLAGDTPTGVTITVTRTDTLALLVTAAAMTTAGGGVYTYAIVDPAPGLTYACTIVFTFSDGATITRIRNIVGSTDSLPRYLQVADALALAPSVVNVAAFLAATALLQNAALSAATGDLDTALRYQGRKVDVQNQVLEFPRVAYEASTGIANYTYIGPLATNSLPGGNTVWDWDGVNLVAIVPDRVKRACLLQANSLLDPVRIANLDRAAAGLTSQKIGSAAETYDIAAMIRASGGTLTLCRPAAALMDYYRLRQGRLL